MDNVDVPDLVGSKGSFNRFVTRMARRKNAENQNPRILTRKVQLFSRI